MARRRAVKGAATTHAEAREKAEALIARENSKQADDEGEQLELPDMPEWFDRIVERVFSIDAAAVYEKLEGQLTIDDALTPQAVRVALNRSEENARLAHQLYVAAKVAHEAYEAEALKVEAVLRENSIRSLSFDKASGHHSKQITDADVTARVALLYPDQHVEIVARRSRAASMLEHLQRHSDLWQSRCRALVALNRN